MSATTNRIKQVDNRLLFSFVAAVIVFAFLGFRLQRNTANLQHLQRAQRVYEYTQCQRSVVNTIKINDTAYAQINFWTQLRPITKDPTSLVRLNNLIDIYQQSLLHVPDCGKKP